MRTMPASTFSCALPKRHWKTALPSVNVVSRHSLRSRVFQGVGKSLITETSSVCPVHIDIILLKPPHSSDSSANKTKQVWKKNKGSWIPSLCSLHHLLLWWEMMGRRVFTQLHIRHLIYTAPDQQREIGILDTASENLMPL